MAGRGEASQGPCVGALRGFLLGSGGGGALKSRAGLRLVASLCDGGAAGPQRARGRSWAGPWAWQAGFLTSLSFWQGYVQL